jgi:hypothetical protein
MTFIIRLRDGRQVPVNADSYMEVEGRHCFYREGEAVAFTYFDSAEVIGISTVPPHGGDDIDVA